MRVNLVVDQDKPIGRRQKNPARGKRHGIVAFGGFGVTDIAADRPALFIKVVASR